MATTLIGTPYYMSPELFSSQPYNQKVSKLELLLLCNMIKMIAVKIYKLIKRKQYLSLH